VDFEPYLTAWRQRFTRQVETTALEARRATALAERLARVLAERYGATRVVLVGSLARGEFAQGSDIDLAVAGVPSEAFFQAGAELERLADGFEVDLVPLESANPFFLERAAGEGVVLI
jgi:uncharacterized protein